jgi:pimeloyl-ACP methyl ester carboxylesterase
VSFGDTLWHQWLKRPYRLHVMEAGKGSPVVLLHGVGASGDVWHPFIKQARLHGKQDDWHILVPDLLGFGDSPKPQWNPYTVDDHARAVIATLRRRGVTRGVTFVAHSMGCLVATHIAALAPKLVTQLVLYEPPLYADDPEFRRHARRREYYFALYEFIATHKQLAFTQAQFFWRVAKNIIGFNLSDDMWVPFERSIRNTIMRQTAYEELHTIHIPTAIIHGRFDLVVTKAELRKMFRANKYITWYTVTDFHGVSARSARFLVELLLAGGRMPKGQRRASARAPRSL